MLTLHQVKTQLPKPTKKHIYIYNQNTLQNIVCFGVIYIYIYRLTVLHKMQSIANTSNISIYIHLHATAKFTSMRVFRDVFRKKNKNTICQITCIYMTNKLVTITQSCLGAYLYSAGTQYRNLLKMLNCLWWQAWWFVTKKLRVTWTLSWNIQTKAIGNIENDTFLSIT